MTYSTLLADAAAIIGRSDLTARIDNWVEQAEMRIARDFFPRGFRAYASSTFTSGSAGAVIDAPTRFLAMISFHVLADSAGTATGSYFYPCLWRTYDWIRAYNPLQSTTGRPLYWTGIDEDQFIVSPSPSAAFDYRLAYYERLAPLSDSNTTNWLTVNAPDILLYATLIESGPHLRDDERIPMWTEQYTERSKGLVVVEQQWRNSDATQGGGAT